ncbi:hypothetical protein NBH19_08650 [Rhizobium sp. S95]|uniref:Uncharacterized protein n=1 Tax=Ciceribacter sichuanensis TaxID=2949647 RepID=A0AAJ1BWU0_9HYPH|nr:MULTISPECIES: hypothetical protein [unclassified Ciceribacter]MCM2396147.1 hypothetical protein [Ciceribacter sp. S95]MCO5957702.1 hypothetical protein [Ciceribacter sp. S101]
MARSPHASLTRIFNASADTSRILQKPSNQTGTVLRRPSVPERVNGDLSGEALARYINGLESRLIDHMRKHAPRWHNNETKTILKRWHAPQASHPVPSWAAPRDMVRDARDYAATLLKERLVSRMKTLGDIRIARYLGGHKQVDPLHLIFHEKSTVLDNKFRQKM